MRILLTDITTCPRCGPAFGLILLVDEAADRRVLTGALACANCRERYPISDGVADFRQGAAATDWGAALPETALRRLVALAGVTGGPGYLLLAGPAALGAADVAQWLPDVTVIAATDGAPATGAVDRITTVDVLPFRDETMAGVILSGGAADALLEDAARLLMLVGRLVLHPIPPQAEARLAKAGLGAIAQDDATLVAVRR